MPRFELEKNLAHLQILIKQSHPEIEALELHMDAGSAFVYIRYNKDFVTKLSFNMNDDPLNLYRRILDDIIDTAFVSNNANMI